MSKDQLLERTAHLYLYLRDKRDGYQVTTVALPDRVYIELLQCLEEVLAHLESEDENDAYYGDE